MASHLVSHQANRAAFMNTSMTNGSMMDMLDMAQDTDGNVAQRVERGLAGGKDKIDFHLNPRNLEMRLALSCRMTGPMFIFK